MVRGECLGRCGTILGGNRLRLQGLRKTLDRRAVDRQWRRSLSEGFCPQPECVEQDDGNDRQQQESEGKPDFPGRLQKSTLS
jgi:hypothetical protein